ncbi:MAG: DNA cytosine methyltransferase [Bacteroidota bacterium]
MRNRHTEKFQIIDLFAGVGGLSLGAVRAGFQISLAVENDKHALSSHFLNFPKVKHWNQDISKVNGAKILQQAGLTIGQLDGLVGGPPCQGFSYIGRRQSGDPRNALFLKFFSLIDECKPSFFVVENVLGILHKKYADILDSAFEIVKGDYEVLEPLKIKACDFGAPTIRERVFFIGYRPDLVQKLSGEDFDNQKVDTPVNVGQALKGLPVNIKKHWLTEPDSWRKLRPVKENEFLYRLNTYIPEGVGNNNALQLYKADRLVSGCFGTNHTPEVEQRYVCLRQGEKDKISRSVRLKKDGFCPTLRAGTGSDRGSHQALRPIHPTQPRVITPREAARLQGFPDWFQFAPSKWHSFRQIGNSVCPTVSEAVFGAIINKLL